METHVLVLSVVFIRAVNDLTIALLKDPDEILGFNNRSIWFEKVPGSMTVQALVNYGLDVICLLVLTVFPELLY